MFRRIASLIFAGLLTATGIGWGQVSDPTSTVFEVVTPQPNDTRQRVKVTPYFMSDNRVGTLLSNDTSWAHIATADSINVYAEGKEMFWVLRYEGKSAADSLIYLRLEEFTYFPNKLVKTYRDTLDFHTALGFPGGEAYADSNTFSMPLGLILTTQTWATYTGGISNWASYIYFMHTKVNPGSNLGAEAVYSLPDLLDSLTVLRLDTLQTTADTFYTSPVPGNYGYNTLFLDKIPLNGTATVFGLGYQTKVNGATAWYGDLTGEALIFSVDDSIYMADTTAAVRISHIPADSIRYVFYGKTALRAILSSVKALWRD